MSRLSAPVMARHVEVFLKSLRHKRPETRGTYERALREFIRWLGSARGPAANARAIRRYKRHLERKKKLTSASVSTYLTAVRRLFAFLHSRGVIHENPAAGVPGNARPRSHSRQPLSLEDADRLLSSLSGGGERDLRDAAVIRLMLRCALSDIEIVRANVGDLRTDGAVTTLAVQGKGRTRKDADVSLPPDVQEAVRLYLAARRTAGAPEPLFAGAGNNSRGLRLTTRGVRDRVNRLLERAGIRTEESRVTPYSLRHTAALLMARDGATAEEIRARLRLGTLATARMYLDSTRHTV